MTTTPQLTNKRIDYGRLYQWDFSTFQEFHALDPPETGLTVAGVTTTGPDNALTLGAPVVTGAQVAMVIGGGTAGEQYTVSVAIVTVPHGYALNLDRTFNVLP